MITIHKAKETLGLKTWVYPAGEIGIRFDVPNPRYLREDANYQTIIVRLQSSVDVMTLIMTVDALRRFDKTPIRLFMPYVPYARQDRVCVPGESFSLKVFAGLINSLGFESVTTLDPHSSVTEAVFDRLTVVSQRDIIHKWDELSNRLRQPDVVLVSPDAGSNKKVSDLASYLGHSHFIRADKLRDLGTGAIKETIVYADDLSGSTVAICDDLIDGGRTFIELAKVLKSKGAKTIILYTTHGILSKGAAPLFNGGIDEVFATNSFRTDIDPRVKTLDTLLFLS